jgi:hypothetical protein
VETDRDRLKQARAFILLFISDKFAKAFKALSDEDRVAVLEAMGGPCSRCGALDTMWCCSDPPQDWD